MAQGYHYVQLSLVGSLVLDFVSLCFLTHIISAFKNEKSYVLVMYDFGMYLIFVLGNQGDHNKACGNYKFLVNTSLQYHLYKI